MTLSELLEELMGLDPETWDAIVRGIPLKPFCQYFTEKSPRRPVPFRGREELGTLPRLLSLCSAYLFNISNPSPAVLGHLRHPRGKPLDADPVRLCQTLARKGAVETRFEAVFGRSEANVPARQEPLQIVAACRLAWRSGQISDFGTDLLRAAESPSPSGEG